MDMRKATADVSGERGIFHTVIEAIADAEGVNPTELSPPLYEVIDPDALENLFTSGLTSGKVVFNYNRCEVSVFSDEYVVVKPMVHNRN